MKKLFLTLLIAAASSMAFAGTPIMKYQLQVRDSAGEILVGSPVTLTVKIHEGAVDGKVVFTEVHEVTTSSAGIVYANIGSKNALSIADLNWGVEELYLETEITHGDSTVNLGTQQMMSVPAAIYAHKTRNLELTSPNGQKWTVTIANDGTISTVKAE